MINYFTDKRALIKKCNCGDTIPCKNNRGMPLTIDKYIIVQDLIDHVVEYRETCKTFNINQPLNTKDNIINLINAILHEALELHEATLFKDEEELSPSDLTEIKKELADVMIYCIALSDYMDEAIFNLITEKIRYNIKRNRLYGRVGENISLADIKEQCRKNTEEMKEDYK